jgi:hypothetical protein
MGVESLLLIFLCVVYGYHATVLLFGTSHCLAIIFGEARLPKCCLMQLCCFYALHLCDQAMLWHQSLPGHRLS